MQACSKITWITHYTLNNKTQGTYNHYDKSYDISNSTYGWKNYRYSRRQRPRPNSGIHQDLTDLYQEYLSNNAIKATHQQYNDTLRRLKLILHLIKVNIPLQASTGWSATNVLLQNQIAQSYIYHLHNSRAHTSTFTRWAARSCPIYPGLLLTI